MTLTVQEINHWARVLLEAERSCRPVNPISTQLPSLSEADAYQIASARLKLRNQIVTGYKLGYTSEAMRRQMNIGSPNFGVLTNDMFVSNSVLEFDELIHPLVEPEIAVRFQGDLPPLPIYDAELLWAAEPEFMLAIEVCDTRYVSYEFSAPDNIADNSSASRYVLGAPFPVTQLSDLADIQVELWISGKLQEEGKSGNAMGNPLTAVAWLANRLRMDSKALKAGDVILTGGLTKGHLVAQGQSVTVKSNRDIPQVMARFV